MRTRIRRVALFLTLVTLLTSVYLFTYSGRIESGDTLTLFDLTSSLVQFGDTRLDLSASKNEPPTGLNADIYPLASAAVEPLQSLLAAPLFWLAFHLPGVGLVHAVWLFNIFVCALSAGVLFVYGQVLGYSERTSILAGLIMGLATIVWPYSKTFFREPLALLFILLAALCLERWRAGRYRWWGMVIGFGVSVAGAVMTKEAVWFALPAFLLIALPSIEVSPRFHRWLTRIALALVLSIAVLVLTTVTGIFDVLIPFFRWLSVSLPGGQNAVGIAFHSFLLSIGGSVWGTSPVTLLALPGFYLLFRQQRYRYLLVPAVVTLTFAFGYSVLRGVHWFGGLSWPPRFLVPVIPFLVIGLMPVLERLWQRPVPTALISISIVLLVYSLWVQLSGILLPWDAYPLALPPESNSLIEWGGGLNLIRYLRWVILPPLWFSSPLDFAWVRTGVGLWPFLFGALIALCGVLLWRLLCQELSTQKQKYVIVGLPILLVGSIWLNMRLIYADPLYQIPSQSALETLLSTLEEESHPDDVLLLANDNYQSFFLNYGKLNRPRVITLPDPPGEQFSPEQPASVTAENPDMLLVKSTIPLIQNLTVSHERLWLLADTGPWIPWSVRPVERFMVQHYYPIQETSLDPTVRLIEYSTVSAPDPFAFREPEARTDLVYGETLRLAGYELPRGTRYRSGDVLPLSLYWQVTSPLTLDVVIAWFVVDESRNVAVQGMDSPPIAGFAHTSAWEAGQAFCDNRALRLPDTVQPGRYRLWVKTYYWDGSTIQVLPVTGAMVVDGTIGVLPVVLDIQ